MSEDEAARAETDEALKETLIRRRFLVPTAHDEAAFSRQFREVAALFSRESGAITRFTILTTTDCNARCPYCYEQGRPRRPMSDATARDTAAFIARVSGGQKVRLIWFGGEPLYNRRAIEIITEELRSRGVPFASDMVSNGYLFDDESVRTAVNGWALEHVQITLDGTEQRYNRIKGYVHAEGSAYARVLKNIDCLLRAGVRVAIRLNVSPDNADDLCTLTDELTERFRSEKRPTLYSVLIRDFSAAATHPETEEDALQAWDLLQRKILASGLGRIERLPRKVQVNGCMADSDDSVTVLPDGRLGKCEHESERLTVGDIYDGVTDAAMTAQWKERVRVPECRTCALEPSCIRLRLCDWTGGRCTEADRKRMRLTVEQRIYGAYRRITAKGTANEADEEPFSGFGR